MGARFLKILIFYAEKGLTSSITRKTLEKQHSNNKMKLHLIIKKGVSKNRLPQAMQFFTLFQTKKKYLTLCRTMVEFRGGDVCRTLILRKTLNKFLNHRIFEKNIIFLAANDRKTLITMSKKGFPIKKPQRFSKSRTWAISPCIYPNFDFFDEN